ncbi:hypothetical protein [Campylobacter mucosalis]|uniref:hypothetical protein n=1 Tax=Campylobacter mucosalis TaxID=202 RepID=UPI0014702294|nr:hypothetical protein [Campylobacter mucosalis]
MYGYIAFNDFINATARSDDDTFAFMAGGKLDNTFAGGSAYNSFVLPGADFRSIFINQSLSLSASIINFNEDFAEFMLMPIQILLTKEREFDIVQMYNKIDKVVQLRQKIRESARERDSKFNHDGSLTNKAKTGNFNGFAAEVVADTALENLIENIATSYMGPIGSAVAGMVYDGVTQGRVNTANVPEAIYNSVKNMTLNTAVNTTVKALGVTSTVSTFAVSAVTSALVSEILETAFGLDNHFGFGGDFVGVDDVGTPVHEAPLGFIDGIKNMLGMLDGVGLITSKEDYYETKQIAGWKNKAGRYMGQIGDDLRGASKTMKEKMREINRRAKENAQRMAKEIEEMGKRTLKEALDEWDREREGRDKSGFSGKDARGETERGTREGLGASGGMMA